MSTHSYEMTGQGVALDTGYLRELGPQAFPAIDEFLAGRDTDHQFAYLAADVTTTRAGIRREQENWRAWTFRDWRLMRCLDGRSSSE